MTAFYTVERHQLPGIPLAVVRRQVSQGELSRVVPECCGLVWNALRAQGIRGGRNVAVYWDGSIRLECGVELQAQFIEQDGVVRSATPAGPVASVTHFGPYRNLAVAHEAIHGWCRTTQHRLAGPSWEIYGHWQTEWDDDPSLIRTDVFYQLLA